jgi:uncharacterized membrane protein
LRRIKMDLKTAKLMGGIGAILTLFILIPVIGWLLGVAGLVLVLISIKTISDAAKEKGIFTNYLVAAILSFIGSLAFLFGGAALMFTKVGVFGDRARNFAIGRGIINHGLWNNRMIGPNMLGSHPGLVIVAVVIAIAVAWVIAIIAGYFTKSSFEKISEKTGEKNFKTAGLLIFLGSILLVLFGAGAIVLLVGVIFEIIAFFSLPDKITETEITQA